MSKVMKKNWTHFGHITDHSKHFNKNKKLKTEKKHIYVFNFCVEICIFGERREKKKENHRITFFYFLFFFFSCVYKTKTSPQTYRKNVTTYTQ